MNQRLGRLAHRRQGDDLLPLVLQARRVYILPTKAGAGFGVLVFVMLLAGLNYTNSVALLLTFALVGYAILGIHETQRQLKGLRVVMAGPGDSFAGDTGRVELRFENTLHVARGPLWLRCGSEADCELELAPRSVGTQFVIYRAPRRGRYRLPRVAISTVAPLGLFRAWSWLHLPLDAIVYPAPGGLRPLPRRGGLRRAGAAAPLATGAEEWASLRPFTPGDSPRAVAWKLYARGAPLLVSQYAGAAGEHHELDFVRLPGLGEEARLSQLAQWVLQCERQREPYSLRLPGVTVPRGLGAAQRQRALRALALHGGAS